MKTLRLEASGLSSLEPGKRWQQAEKLLKQCPAHNQTTDLLIYYGIKDIAGKHPDKSLALLRAAEDNHYPFTKNLCRNLAENSVFEPLVTFLDSSANEALSASILEGFAAGIKGRKNLSSPGGWDAVFDSYFDHPDLRKNALAINFSFNEAKSIEKLSTLLASSPGEALAVLADYPVGSLTKSIIPLLKKPELAPLATRVLANFNRPEVATALISHYPEFPPVTRQLAINALSGNRRFAAQLLDAIESKEIPSHAMTAYHAQQIKTYKDKVLSKRLESVWGRTGSTSGEKRAEIKRWQDQLLPDVLARADLKNGHSHFQQLCMACHQLNGEGGAIGPELTGANRRDLYYLLENIIDPGATLPADFQLTVVTKTDGSVVSGNIKGRNEYSITLTNLAGETTVLLEDVAKQELMQQSLMPDGLLNALAPDDVRDLIAYLQK